MRSSADAAAAVQSFAAAFSVGLERRVTGWQIGSDPLLSRPWRYDSVYPLGDTCSPDCSKRVIVWAQPELLPLLRNVAGIDELIPQHDGKPDVEFDIDVEVMELPHVFRSTLKTLPAHTPYLGTRAVPRPGAMMRTCKWIVWECGNWAPERAIPMRELKRLAEGPRHHLHIMQRGSGLAQRPANFGIVSGADDLLEAAATIAALDLMISIDSMPAHLAGGLGVPAWTLLQSEADWRWMDSRADTPWYPTMRLFRQERAGDWATVIVCAAEELRALTVAA